MEEKKQFGAGIDLNNIQKSDLMPTKLLTLKSRDM